MKFIYDVLLKIASDRVNGFTLSELTPSFTESKLKIASALGELELLCFIRGLWVINSDNRWERRYYSVGEGTPDFVKLLNSYKQKYG